MAGFRSCAPHRTEHTRVIHASPRTLYDLVAEVERWGVVFDSVAHARSLRRTGRGERCEVWAWEEGGITTWNGSRVADPYRLYIGFTWEPGALPVPVGGCWYFRPLPGDRTEVVLRHRFAPGDDARTAGDRVRRILDRRAHQQLDALVRIASLTGGGAPSPVFSFTDTFAVPGAAAAHHDMVRRADLWAERLPQVARSTVTALHPQVHALELDTIGPEGFARRTRSVRVCHDSGWIAHKELVTARPLIGHTGVWTFAEGLRTPVVTVRHTVVIDPAAVCGGAGNRVSAESVPAGIRETLRRDARAVLAGTSCRFRASRTAQAS